MDARTLLATFAFVSSACWPKPQSQPIATAEATDEQPAAVEQDGKSTIPWAEGEGPGPAREVGEQPRSSDEPMPEEVFETTQGDGVVQTGGSKQCTGRATNPLRAEVQARTSALGACNEQAPTTFRGTGLLKYTVRVEQDGRVETIYQLENTLKLSAVIDCVESKLKEKFDEAPLSGCTQFIVPYELRVEAVEDDENDGE